MPTLEKAVITNTIGIVPTAAQRSGDFSAALTGTCNGPDPTGQPVCFNQIFDPSTNQVVNGSVVRSPFPGNKIPADRWDPVASQLLALYPSPNLTGKNNFFSNQKESVSNDQYIGRIDHQLIRILAFQNSGIDLPVLHRHQHAFEPLGNLLVRIQYRFQNVLAIMPERPSPSSSMVMTSARSYRERKKALAA